ncbi:MAG: tRNA pseudouridine(38-40) synthase TruA [Clostridia bacterium]|nr:tRNA pseudouridine(38-40) synthase TruA [Clostridia bacterium]
MRNIALLIEYDGGHFSGWQSQRDGVITIQTVIENALSKIVGHSVKIYGSGRTDVGVHACGQVANFYTDNQIPCFKLCLGANILLAPYVSIRKAVDVQDDFNARRCAVKKLYKFCMYSSPTPSPLKNPTHMQVYKPLDGAAMQKAANYIVGKKDFRCFMASGSGVEDTVREVYSLEITQNGDVTILNICGNAFLYNMVRIIAGTLINVGLHKIEPEYMKTIIESKNRKLCGKTAWARGLTLVKVFYEPDIFN